jgi:purine-binding chemotaxis protein CheW
MLSEVRERSIRDMDILAARKKAAERARSQQKQEQSAALQPVKPQTSMIGETPLDSEACPPANEVVQTSQDVEIRPSEPQAAEAVSQEIDQEHANTPTREIEMLSFRLGSEEYAVMVESVREVLKRRDLTMVPNTPDYIPGVISLRGAMLPVIDLCIRLGITLGARDEKSRIIVVSPDDEDVGLIVDRVTGVHRINEDEIKPPPENIEHGGEFLRGIVRKDDKLYIVLDLVKAVGRYDA